MSHFYIPFDVTTAVFTVITRGYFEQKEIFMTLMHSYSKGTAWYDSRGFEKWRHCANEHHGTAKKEPQPSTCYPMLQYSVKLLGNKGKREIASGIHKRNSM